MLIDIFSGASEGMGPPEGTRYTNKPGGKSDRLKVCHFKQTLTNRRA
jgi:hypothetical protein